MLDLADFKRKILEWPSCVRIVRIFVSFGMERIYDVCNTEVSRESI
jgi:hypothetical protein